MTFLCPTCDVRWPPYMIRDSACPRCRTGLKPSQEPMSEGAVALYAEIRRAAGVEQDRLDEVTAYDTRHTRFDDYYLKRAQDHDAALPHEYDELEEQGRLPSGGPGERAA